MSTSKCTKINSKHPHPHLLLSKTVMCVATLCRKVISCVAGVDLVLREAQLISKTGLSQCVAQAQVTKGGEDVQAPAGLDPLD